MEIHTGIGGTAVGRRVGVEVLNRSAIVLITATWEGYVEDLAREALDCLVDHLVEPDDLPRTLRKSINKEIKKDQHEFAAWKLAGPGWKTYLTSRLTKYSATRAQILNTPKSDQVDTLFRTALEISRLSEAWTWRGMTAQRARDKLDAMVGLRGDIAHGSGADKGVQRPTVESYLNHAKRLVTATDEAVNAYLRGVGAGKCLF